MTDFTLVAGSGTGGPARLTAQELALLPHLASHVDTKAASILDIGKPQGIASVFGTTTFSTKAQFVAFDKANQGCKMLGGGSATPKSVRINGQHWLVAPGSGYGALYYPSVLDDFGAETNNVDRVAPGGYSTFGDFIIPAPNTTLYGYTFGANTGMALVGSSSDTPTNDLVINVDANGHFQVQNRRGSIMYQHNALTLNDGAPHTYEVVNDPASSTITVKIDGVVRPSIGGGGIAAYQDVTGANDGSRKLTIGGWGSPMNENETFVGFFRRRGWVPSTFLSDPSAQTVVENWLAQPTI